MIGNLAIKLLAPLLKMIFPKIDAKLKEQRQEIIEHIFKIGKIEENNRYREEPNDADRKIEKLETKLQMLIEDSHPPAIDLEEWEDMKAMMKKLKNKKAFKSIG